VGAVLPVYENESVVIENKYSRLLAGSVPDIRTIMPLSPTAVAGSVDW
jgi:hypothetical protein